MQCTIDRGRDRSRSAAASAPTLVVLLTAHSHRSQAGVICDNSVPSGKRVSNSRKTRQVKLETNNYTAFRAGSRRLGAELHEQRVGVTRRCVTVKSPQLYYRWSPYRCSNGPCLPAVRRNISHNPQLSTQKYLGWGTARWIHETYGTRDRPPAPVQKRKVTKNNLFTPRLRPHSPRAHLLASCTRREGFFLREKKYSQ